MKDALLIFIKNIEKGKVKTRLAATVGEERALQIYQALVGHTRKVGLGIDVTRYLFYSSYLERDDWSSDDFEKYLQEGKDLGIRMVNAFKKAFEKNEKVIIIGSDCASLTSDILKEAFGLLNNHDFVIGPAQDGGYYLIGMNAFEPSVFENMEWSTETVFKKTIEKIKVLNKRYALLPTLSDIDYEEDWLKYGWEI
ncbi:TIGR04282 family arsenosugar biosynthesis glycosyltransferase [Saprospiraceae bacterium]|jgi:rSAM/selenodomain-associated transferase 1|nr:TIGR04282 family arsenosugar biosynthesis glycosyltransferase [Bacteroidota bacterium]MDB4727248.1 TIGR04282 family arsenosugar biosynthesis glycosyltransferase [Saprospiraceae bacterium]MDF1864538.1 TIGR04282 family arsenosugar biosynthesis glycosyltransferase [Saprospiraceae bacterium]